MFLPVELCQQSPLKNRQYGLELSQNPVSTRSDHLDSLDSRIAVITSLGLRVTRLAEADPQ